MAVSTPIDTTETSKPPSSSKPPSAASKPVSTALSAVPTFPPSAYFSTQEAEREFLETVEGEISFFRSTMRARPVGMHRFFHVLAIRNAIYKDTGRLVRVDTIWEKLRRCWDLDALDAIDIEANNYLPSASSSAAPKSIPSPSPSDNLNRHDFFRNEFQLPPNMFEELMMQRRAASVASTPSPSPPPRPAPVPKPPPPKNPRGRPRKRKTKADMAGLVGGDSDSSALTQESGDDIAGGGERESVVTGTDAGTEYADDDGDVEMRDPSPEPSTSPRPTRGRKPGPKKGSTRGRGGTTSVRGAKKRKRG